MQRGIRGAITVETNSVEAVKEATIELILEMKKSNLMPAIVLSSICLVVALLLSFVNIG